MNETEFDQAIAQHDQLIASHNQVIWVGTEPTFTDRFSNTPEWISAALGDEKVSRAEQLLRALHAHLGGVVLRTSGRQYPGEDRPRWSLGLYGWRDGSRPWRGPLDPALNGQCTNSPDMDALRDTFMRGLAGVGYRSRRFEGDDGSLRLLACVDASFDLETDHPDTRRGSLHDAALPPEGIVDSLAEAGAWLFIFDTLPWHDGRVARVELPSCDTPERYAVWLEQLGSAAITCHLDSIILTGYPPPIDAQVCLTTITPDPAVIEINMAPYADVSGLLRATRALYASARAVGLSPYRLHFNGGIADSGGGGQITLGGPSPLESPFLREPMLLPRLIRYVNHHPALSYLFSHDFVGGSGQAVRADERGSEALRELELALALLARHPPTEPRKLWEGLAQHLTDTTGNTHRAELNIEKLWNPYLPNRGMQGLVEFRALRMQHSPKRVAAIAALLRSIVAMLAVREFDAPLQDWGHELHDRFALPYYLERDLESVLDDLADCGLTLPAPLADQLRLDEHRHWVTLEHAGRVLTIRRALEFWPLVGDAGQQGERTSRLIDASTMRLEICLKSTQDGPHALDDWRLIVQGTELPLRHEHNARVFGLRLRHFEPWLGLHPELPAYGPVRLLLTHPAATEALSITLHDWHPDGLAYNGLPADLSDARSRREARCVTEALPAADLDLSNLRTAPRGALTDYTLDLRWLQVVG